MKRILVAGWLAAAGLVSGCVALPLAGIGAAIGAAEVVAAGTTAVSSVGAGASSAAASAAGGGMAQSGAGFKQSAGPGGASQSGPGYQQQARPGYVSQSGPGYQQQARPGYVSQSGPGYSQEAGPGYARQSGPGFEQEAGMPAPGPQDAATAAGAAIFVSQAGRSRATRSCKAECASGTVSIGCPAGSAPVCQCEKRPYAACRDAGRD